MYIDEVHYLLHHMFGGFFYVYTRFLSLVKDLAILVYLCCNTYCNVYRFLTVDQVVQKYPMQYSLTYSRQNLHLLFVFVVLFFYYFFFYMKPIFV
jgi:hypothetical protein